MRKIILSLTFLTSVSSFASDYRADELDINITDSSQMKKFQCGLKSEQGRKDEINTIKRKLVLNALNGEVAVTAYQTTIIFNKKVFSNTPAGESYDLTGTKVVCKELGGKVLKGQATVLGAIDPEIITNILKDNVTKFRSCYQRMLERTETSSVFSGKLFFLIRQDGKIIRPNFLVDNVAKKNETENISKCIEEVTQNMYIPSFVVRNGIINVSQDLEFKKLDE